jgi:hypothetical protein
MGFFDILKKDVPPKKVTKEVTKKVTKKSNTRRNFSRSQKTEVLKNQKNRCANYGHSFFAVNCKNKFNEWVLPEWDHIDSNDSNNKISNCQALCSNCHTVKSRLEQMNSTKKGRKNYEKWEAANRHGQNPPPLFSKEWKQVRDKYPDWSVLDQGL